MTPATVQLILGLLALAREGLRQVDLAKLDELPPELRQQLIDERNALMDEWAGLAPS